MSSTKRGGKRSTADYYPTPAWCVRRLFDNLPLLHSLTTWLEPGAGDGAIIRAADPYLAHARWTAVELRDTPADFGGLAHVDLHVGDYLEHPPPPEPYDVAITNPPFSLAMDFYRKMRAEARRVILLLRLNWIAPPVRSDELREDMPAIRVLPNRPSFTGQGTDSIEYAWFLWGPVRSQVSTLRILPSTPLPERRADQPHPK